jgi:hypothetical protein
MRIQSSLPHLIFLVVCLAAFLGIAAPAQTITVSFPKSLSSVPLDGRILLLLSNDPSREPRMQIDRTMLSQQVFGVTVNRRFGRYGPGSNRQAKHGRARL